MKILIAGCGYVGTALGKYLVRSGHEVWGIRRQWPADRANGIRPITADLSKFASLQDLPPADVVVLCQAPSRQDDRYRETYFEGTRNLVAALRDKKPRKLILISSTSVYSQKGGEWVDEATPPGADAYETEEAAQNAKVLLETERFVLNSELPATVFRLGGIYGPGRHRLRLLKEGKMKPSFSDVYTNRIHVDDVVAGIVLLMEKGKAGEVYLGVDDAPSTQKEFYSWLCEKVSLTVKGSDPVTSGGQTPLRAHGPNKRCSNKKIKDLGLKLKYPSFREGYAELIEEVYG